MNLEKDLNRYLYNYDKFSFLSGQPDNINNIENCVEIRSTQTWYDHNCYLSKGWMCKIEKGIDPNANVIQVNETFTGTSIK